MPPAARVTDMHTCPMVTVLVPHVGGPILPPCQINVLIGGLPAARVTDLCLCATGPPDMIVKGSATVYIGGLPAARIGDLTSHGGVIVVGHPLTIIGDSSSAGAPGGAGGPGAGEGSSLLANAEAFSAETQADTLRQAARDGTAFCEICKS